MASETVASPMRLATAPGRPARPAPPGNNDPCEERRTIPEGLPRLPREALHEASDGRFLSMLSPGGLARRSFSGGGTTASTGPGQKSHVERRKGERFPSPGNAGRLDASRAGCPGCAYRSRPRASCGAQRTQGGLLLGLADRWGVRRPVMACRSGCVASIQAPPVLRTPLAKGQRNEKKKEVERERRRE